MPRDVNGNMTLVAGNPVVSGTAISSTVQNNTMADLAAEIEDSLSRSGKGGMLVPLPNSDGTVGAPGITFTSETTTGWYRAAAGQIGGAILGVIRFLLSATGLSVTGTVTASNGLVATAGGVTATAGGLTVTAGAVSLPSGSVARTALASVGQQTSASSSTFFHTADTNWTDVFTGLTSPLTTSGRPVVLSLQSAVSVSPGSMNILADAGGTRAMDWKWLRNTNGAGWVDIARYTVSAPASGRTYAGSTTHIDTTAIAGSVNYKLQVMVDNASATAYVTEMQIVAYEL